LGCATVAVGVGSIRNQLILLGILLAFIVGIWTYLSQENYDQLVENGVHQIVVCGEKKGSMMPHPKIIDNFIVDKMLKVTPGSHIGFWDVESKGDCNVWTHYAAGPGRD
jgi:hypothetical protein